MIGEPDWNAAAGLQPKGKGKVMAKTDEQKCVSCAYYDTGDCRRHAPRIAPDTAVRFGWNDTVGIWPTVYADSWCGEYVGRDGRKFAPPMEEPEWAKCVLTNEQAIIKLAHEAGRQAFVDGLDRTVNPYSQKSDCFAAWNRGYSFQDETYGGKD